MVTQKNLTRLVLTDDRKGFAKEGTSKKISTELIGELVEITCESYATSFISRNPGNYPPLSEGYIAGFAPQDANAYYVFSEKKHCIQEKDLRGITVKYKSQVQFFKI